MKQLFRRLTRRIEGNLQHKTASLIYLLGLIGVAVILLITVLEFILRGSTGIGLGIVSEAWQNFTFFIDAGKITEIDPTKASILEFAFKTLITIFGILIFSTLIGAISQVVDEYVSNIRSGNSPARSESHTILIGYSSLVPLIIKDAFEEDKNKDFVIYSDTDETVMRSGIAETLSAGGNIVFKKGRGERIEHSKYLNLLSADRVIILREDRVGSGGTSLDVENMQILTNLVLSTEWKKNQCSITVEIRDEEIMASARRYCTNLNHVTPFNQPNFLNTQFARDTLLSGFVTNTSAFNYVKSTFGFASEEVHFFSFRELKGLSQNIVNLSLREVAFSLSESVLIAITQDSTDQFGTYQIITTRIPANYCLQEGFSLLIFSDNRRTAIKDLKRSSKLDFSQKGSSRQTDLEIAKFTNHVPKQICIISNDQSIDDLVKFTMELFLQHQALSRLHIAINKNGVHSFSSEEFEDRLKTQIKRVFESSNYRSAKEFGHEVLPCVFNDDSFEIEDQNHPDAGRYCYFQIMAFGDSRDIWFKNGPREGDSIIGIHAISATEKIDYSQYKWTDFWNNRLGIKCLTSMNPIGASTQHSLIKQSANRALGAFPDRQIILIWFREVGDDIHISPIEYPDALFSKFDRNVFNRSRAPKDLESFEEIDSFSVVVSEFEGFEIPDAAASSDGVVFFNSTQDLNTTISIDTFSERHFLGEFGASKMDFARIFYPSWYGLEAEKSAVSLRSSQRIEINYNFSLNESGTPTNDMTEDLLEIDSEALFDLLTHMPDSADESSYPKNFLFLVSDKNTSARIDMMADSYYSNIGSFEQDTFISRLVSSLSVDSKNAKLLKALETGELEFRTNEITLSRPCSLSEISRFFVENGFGSIVGYKLRSKFNGEYQSIIKDLARSIDEPLSVLYYASTERRRLFSPNYWI